jgi:hypothetical protein
VGAPDTSTAAAVVDSAAPLSLSACVGSTGRALLPAVPLGARKEAGSGPTVDAMAAQVQHTAASGDRILSRFTDGAPTDAMEAMKPEIMRALFHAIYFNTPCDELTARVTLEEPKSTVRAATGASKATATKSACSRGPITAGGKSAFTASHDTPLLPSPPALPPILYWHTDAAFVARIAALEPRMYSAFKLRRSQRDPTLPFSQTHAFDLVRRVLEAWDGTAMMVSDEHWVGGARSMYSLAFRAP